MLQHQNGTAQTVALFLELRKTMSEKNPLNPDKIDAVVAFVKANPGCTKKAASEAVAKQASYGYRFVQAAIEQGRVMATRQENVLGRPYVLKAS
jgi:hypothetical protein